MDVASPPRREDDVRVARAAASRGFWLPAATLVLLHTLLTIWRLRSAWWWQDDLVILSRASGRPLSELVLSEYNGHLVPATWFVAWLVDRGDPLAWRWGALSIGILVLVTDAALALVLARLFGARRAAVVPLAMYVSAGSLLTPTLWWAAAMQWLPVTASLLLALYHHVGYRRSGRTWDAGGSVLAVVAGLAFFEKAVLVVGVLFAFAVLYEETGPAVPRVRAALRRAPSYWRAHVVVAGAFSAYYLSVAEGDSNGSSDPMEIVRLVKAVVVDVVVPSIFGGPLAWFGSYSSLPDSATWFRATTVALFGLCVVGSLATRRGAWRAWLLLVLFLTVTVGLVAATRLGFFGATIGLDGRYSADLVAVTVLCAALAWLPLTDRSPGAPALRDAGASEDTPSAVLERRTTRLDGVRPALVRGVGTAFVVAVLAAGTVSANRYTAAWTPPPAKGYVLTLTSELQGRPDVVLFDQRAPEQVLQATFGDESRLSTLLAPTGVTPTLRSWQTQLRVVDDTGRIRDAALPGDPASATATPLCAAPGQPLRVRLDGRPLALETWTLKFNYLVNEPSVLGLTLGLVSTEVAVEQGLHEVFVQTDGNGDSVVLTPPADATGLCVTNLVVGKPTAA